MKFSDKDKEILHSYVDNSSINEIIYYIENNFGSEKDRYLQEINETNKLFDKNELITKIKEIIERNHDDTDDINIFELENELQIVYTEHHYLRGDEEEMIYSNKKVKVVLENIPNIIYEKFNKVPYVPYSTITEYIICNNDLKNLKLVNKILNKDKKTFIDVIESELNAVSKASKDIIIYIITSLKKDPNYTINNLIKSINESDNSYYIDDQNMEANEFIEFIQEIDKNFIIFK